MTVEATLDNLERYPIVSTRGMYKKTFERAKMRLVGEDSDQRFFMVTHHLCKHCLKWRNIFEFKPDKKGKDGYAFICKKCNSKRTTFYQCRKRGSRRALKEIDLFLRLFKDFPRPEKKVALRRLRDTFMDDLREFAKENLEGL